MATEAPNRIAEFRNAAGLTQQHLAEKLGVHWITVSKLERGKIKLTLDHMSRLAPLLNVEIRDLLPEDDERHSALGGGAPPDQDRQAADLLGERIKSFRTLRGLSQADLGKACGVYPSTVTRWEACSAVPAADNIPLIAKTLGVSILDLFGMGEATAPIRVRFGGAHTEAARLTGAETPEERVRARDTIIALAERLKIEAAQGLT